MTIKVLLADDHALVLDGLRALLEPHHDIRVIGHVSNGREAVKLAVEKQPDIVVMDISMPELNGIEAMQLIQEKCAKTQIIILSMHSNSEHVFRALQSGARGYLLKSSAGKEAVKAIRNVYAGNRYISQKLAGSVIDDYVQDRHSSSPLDSLSSREKQVLQMFIEGHSVAKTAETLFLSPRTVETYRARVMQKLDVHNLPALVKFAIQHGLTPAD